MSIYCPSSLSARSARSAALGCNWIYKYHCLRNKKDETIEKCLEFSWIQKGKCAVYDTEAQQIDAWPCTITRGVCPQEQYQSQDVMTYSACVPLSYSTKNSTDGRNDNEDSSNNNHNNNNNNADVGGTDQSLAITSVTCLAVIGIVVVVVAALMYWRWKRKRNSGMDEENAEPLIDFPKNGNERTQEAKHHLTREEKERKIVQLTAYAKGKQILTENGILVITGRVGSGKSTAMNRIIQLLNDDQCDEKKWKVEEALSWNKELQYEGQVIITWDDCFGQFVTYPTKREKTRKRINELVKWIKVDNRNRKLVLTMSETVFKDFNCADYLEVWEADCELCLDGMSNDEKSSLVAATFEYIREYSEFKDDTWDGVNRKLHELISNEYESVIIGSLGWPLICRLATIPYIANDFAAFIEDPFTCVQSLFDDLNSTNQNLLIYYAMICVSFNGIYSSKDPEFLRKFKKEVVKNRMHHTNDKEKADFVGMLNSEDAIIKKLSSELSREYPSAYSHYFLKTGEEFQLFHNIFQLWLLCHFYKQFPELTVQYLDYDLLLELLRPTDHFIEYFEEEIAQICGFEDKDGNAAFEDNNKNKEWKFILERNMYDLFLGRVRTKDEKNLIENKQNSVFNHPLLDDSTFRKILQLQFAATKGSNTV